MFEERPFFTSQGTCFYTKAVTHEAYPHTWSSVEAWLKFDKEASPGLGNFFKMATK